MSSDGRQNQDDTRFHADCGLCGNRRQQGAQHMQGRNVPGWGMWICNRCREANHDGIVPESNAEFMARLRARGVPLQLNAIGWLKIPD